MKQFSKFVTIACLVLIAAFVPVVVVSASPSVAPIFQESAPPSLDGLMTTLKNLGGVALLIAALINAGKKKGWIQDGQAPTVSLVLNGIALAGLVGLQVTGNSDAVPALDVQAGMFAEAINAVVALVFQLYVSRAGHEQVLSGMPMIGKSFSAERVG